MPHTPNRIDAALLTRLLPSALGHCGDVTNYCIICKDEDYVVIAARLTGPTQEVMIKLAGPRAVLTSAFERTATIVQLVRSHSAVLTFDVLAVDVSYRLWPWRYIVTTVVPGEHWLNVPPKGHGRYCQLNGNCRANYDENLLKMGIHPFFSAQFLVS